MPVLEAGSAQTHDYPLQDLNMVSKIKLAFLPKKPAVRLSTFKARRM